MTKEYVFKADLVINAPLEKVFEFFANAENLEKITPEFMQFKIITPTPIQMRKGTLIDYKLKVRGVPMKWRTLIDEWELNKKFVDTQLKGPYKLWHHTHEFMALTPTSTKMTDTVRYIVPFGFLGRLVHPILVRPDVEKIFAYRNSTIPLFFPTKNSSFPSDGN